MMEGKFETRKDRIERELKSVLTAVGKIGMAAGEAAVARPQSKLERELAPLDMIPGVGPGMGIMFGITKSKAVTKWLNALKKVTDKSIADFIFSKGKHLKTEELGELKHLLMRNAVEGKRLIQETPQKELDRIEAILPFSERSALRGFYSPKRNTSKEKLTPSINLNIAKAKTPHELETTYVHELTHARQFEEISGKPRTTSEIQRTKLIQELQGQKKTVAELDMPKIDFYTSFNPTEALARKVEKAPLSKFEETYNNSMNEFVELLVDYRENAFNKNILISWEDKLNLNR